MAPCLPWQFPQSRLAPRDLRRKPSFDLWRLKKVFQKIPALSPLHFRLDVCLASRPKACESHSVFIASRSRNTFRRTCISNALPKARCTFEWRTRALPCNPLGNTRPDCSPSIYHARRLSLQIRFIARRAIPTHRKCERLNPSATDCQRESNDASPSK